jgi:tetratricopeptide (TPR) repeat protein
VVGAILAGVPLALMGWAAWHERAARQALAEEHFDLAKRHIDQALRVRQRCASTVLLASRIARARGAYAEAEQYLTSSGQQHGMSASLQLEWLLLRCQRGEVDELAPQLLALVERHHPESPAILEALAGVYMRQTRYWEALRCLDRWVERAPDSVRALDWHGWVCNQLDHRGRAVSDYEQILQLQPGRSTIRFRLADILVESSRHAEAVPHLEQLREEGADNPEVLVALARCRMVQARTDEARALLDSVLEVHPGSFEALVCYGELELVLQHYRHAEGWLRKALAKKPLAPDTRYILYRSLQAQPNRQREAEKELERWKRDRQAQDRLIRLLRTELDSKPNDPELARETGELFLELGEVQRGLFWLGRALSLDPRHVRSHRALIAYYERTNNPAKAAHQREKMAALGVGP